MGKHVLVLRAALIVAPRGDAVDVVVTHYRLSTGCNRLILAGFPPAYVWIQSTRTTQIMNHFLAVVAQLALSVAWMRSATGLAMVQKTPGFYPRARPASPCSVWADLVRPFAALTARFLSFARSGGCVIVHLIGF